MRRSKRKNFIIQILLLALFLTSCGGNTGVSIPSNTVWAQGIGNSGFLTLTTEMQEVHSPKEMRDANTMYALKEDTSISYVQRNSFLIVECEEEAKDLADIKDDIERDAHMRLISTREISQTTTPYRGQVKTIYEASVEGLFTSTLYADYTGYLSVIEKNGRKSILFAGGSIPALNIVQSHWFKEYASLVNKGQVEDIEDEDKTGFTDIAVLYRGSEGTENKAFGLKLESIKEDAKEEIEAWIKKSGSKLSLEQKQGYEWQIATFSVDTKGYDISSSLPDVPVRIKDGNRNTETYLMNYDGEILELFYMQKKDAAPIFYCGRNEAAINGGNENA